MVNNLASYWKGPEFKPGGQLLWLRFVTIFTRCSRQIVA